jgi:hypothetical protein
MKKQHCSHPKNRIASYIDERTNTYIERCIKCTSKLYVRKFPKVNK